MYTDMSEISVSLRPGSFIYKIGGGEKSENSAVYVFMSIFISFIHSFILSVNTY